MKKKRVRKGIVVSFGANDSKNPKNDICLYRVYTYARKLDKSISTTSAWNNIFTLCLKLGISVCGT